MKKKMNIEIDLERRGLILCGIGRERDGELMIKGAQAIHLLRNGYCPYCGMPLPEPPKEGET
jgi:hypothetical protein